MTRDDIIRMAREAGGDDWGIFRDFMPEIERFAALVAAHEREECAKVCEAHANVYLLIESPIANAGWSACIDNRDAIKARGQA